MNDLAPKHLRELAFLCGGMALLIGVAAFISSGASFGSHSFDVAVNNISNTQGAAVANFASTCTPASPCAFTVPVGITSLAVQVSGAGGSMGQEANVGNCSGTGNPVYSIPYYGGPGGQTTANVPVTPGQILYIVAGSDTGGGAFSETGGGTGGGYSGIFTGSTPSQANALVIAGGGGGGGSWSNSADTSCGGQSPAGGNQIYQTGGSGGGTTGGSSPGATNAGGTQTAGGSGSGSPAAFSGSALTGGGGLRASYFSGGGGGGSGYYGGGEGGQYAGIPYAGSVWGSSFGGGGGSSYCSPSVSSCSSVTGGGAAASSNGSVSITYYNCTMTNLSPSPVTSGQSSTLTYSTQGSASSAQLTYTLPSGVTASPNPTNFTPATSGTTPTGTFTNTTGTNQTGTITMKVAYSTGTASCTYGPFTIAPPPIPVVTTVGASGVTATAATLNGSISSSGNGNATIVGFAWSTSPTMTSGVSTTSQSGSFGTGATFNSSISGLTQNVTYYLRAYATNSFGTGYGNIQSFSTGLTPSCSISSVTSATTNDGYADVTYTMSGNPTDSEMTYELPSSITAYNPGPTYVNPSFTDIDTTWLENTGTTQQTATIVITVSSSAGSSSCFGTTIVQANPIVDTDNAVSTSGTTETLNGDWTAGSGNANELGFFWGTDPALQSGFHVVAQDGSFGVGSFSLGITGLTQGITYYYEAYAANGAGTGWGGINSFTAGVTAPTVTTVAANPVNSTSATLNGSANPNIGTTTGQFIYEKLGGGGGSCPSNIGQFGGTTVPSSAIQLGNGSNPVSYSTQITGLQTSATYCFQAEAQNVAGTTYGSVLSFIAQNPTPSVTLNANPTTVVTGTPATLTWSVSNLSP